MLQFLFPNAAWIVQEIKRARRMFKSMDCDNLKETSQKMIVDTFAPRPGDKRRRRGSRRNKDR